MVLDAGNFITNDLQTRMMNQRNLKLKPGDGTVIYRSAAHCLVTVSYFCLILIVIGVTIIAKAKFLLLSYSRVHPNNFIGIINHC